MQVDDELPHPRSWRAWFTASPATVFVADPATRTVLERHRVSAGTGGRLLVTDEGQVYGLTRTTLFRLDEAGPTTLLSGLSGGWYNEPQLAYDEATGDLFAVRGRDLVRVDLTWHAASTPATWPPGP